MGTVLLPNPLTPAAEDADSIVTMPQRPLVILLTAILAFQTALSGAGGVAVLCLGGGHEHAPAETEHCESACGHEAAWPLPLPADEFEHGCGCTDIELTIPELLTLPRADEVGKVFPTISTPPAWGIVIAQSGLGQRGPPMAQPGFDPGGLHRLAIVASVRLTI